jgi:hypothetical protein
MAAGLPAVVGTTRDLGCGLRPIAARALPAAQLTHGAGRARFD